MVVADFVVDRVREDAPGLDEWVARVVREAVERARSDGRTSHGLATDGARDLHYLVRATPEPEGAVHVQVIDVSPAIALYRSALVASVVHFCRNAAFAVSSVVDVIAEGPLDTELAAGFERIRSSVGRLVSVMGDIHRAYLPSEAPKRRAIDASDVLRRVDPRTTHSDLGLPLDADLDAIAGAVTAMAAMFQEPPTLGACHDVRDERPHARFFAEGVSSLDPTAHESLFEVAGGQLGVRAALARARTVAVLHGGAVRVGRSPEGRVAFELWLPLTASSGPGSPTR